MLSGVYAIGFLCLISNGKSSIFPYIKLWIHKILSQPNLELAYPNSIRTLGLLIFLKSILGFIIDISATKISHWSILANILLANSGVPISPRLSLSILQSDIILLFAWISFIAASRQFFINCLFVLLGKSDCQE